MSGSFVFRSGVGTQIFIVSSSPTAAKSLVAESFPSLTRDRQDRLGNILDIRFALIDKAVLLC